MIVEEKNKDGYIIGYIEFEIVNDLGQFKEQGDFIYIQNSWIHEGQRGTMVLRKLIGQVHRHEFSKSAKYVYWTRDRFNDRQTRSFPRDRLAKMGV